MTWHRLRPHVHQFACYLGSGAAAVLLDFGSYFLLLRLGVWYVTGNIISNALGFFGAFLCHKYLVFRSHGKMVDHFLRYCILTSFNLLVQTLLLVFLVESLSLDAGAAKILSFAVSVLGNFFLYRSFVYV